MIKLTDLYLAVNTLLYSKYSKVEYKIYGHEVVEGYSKPSFFVDLIPKTMSNESMHYKKYSYTIMITYFQKVANEIDNLIKIDEIKELFGFHLNLSNRKIPIMDFDYDFIGENSNILQMSIEIEYLDSIDRIEEQPKATEMYFKTIEKR